MNDFEEFELRYADDLDALNDFEASSVACEPNELKRNLDGCQGGIDKHNENIADSPHLETSSNKRSASPVDFLKVDCSILPAFKKLKSQGNEIDEDLQKRQSIDTSSLTSAPPKSLRATGIPITKFDGSRVYFSLTDCDPGNVSNFSHSTSSSLLSTSVSLLKEEIFSRRGNISGTSKTRAERTSQANSHLWVEKYRPRSFVDLLSDEGVNRILLSWLKLWDKVVFGRDIRKKDKKPASQFPQKQISKFRKPVVDLTDTLDEFGRPMQKVALLFGPPGLGKTTLAHVIAHHAGYNVVELNASDDRSPDIFRCNLEAATQMKAVMGKDKRPNCLIIDEIDGAPIQSINVLLSFIQSTGFPKGKRKKGELPILKRPIICICNDQYVPALKTLRQIALSINFPFTSRTRLASRLGELASKEGLKAEMSLLLLLCDKADNDIRSCLSTLQFLCTTKKELRAADLANANIGQKDVHQSLFSIWQDVFYSVRSELSTKFDCERNKFVPPIKDNISPCSISKVLKATRAFGDYEKLFTGLFQNYLCVKPNKLCFDALCKGSDWLCFADTLQSEIWSDQQFQLLPYLSYIPVAFHLLFCSPGISQLSYPSAYYDCVAKRMQMTNVLNSMVSEVVTSLKTFCNVNALITDILPAVAEIIKPSLRPVSTHLYTEHEKKELRKVIDVMISFNLNYRQERSADGQYNYVLEPNIQELVGFKGTKSLKSLSYAAKQLIAQEVSVEKMRRNDTEGNKSDQEISKSAIPLNKKPVKQECTVVEKPMLDFFGRKIKVSEKMKEKTSSKNNKSNIWFHFKEGYSNAVRRTVYMKDFM